MSMAVGTSTFEPRELALLKKVFDDVCVERGVIGGSPAASALAAEMIELYQHGMRDATILHRHFDGRSFFG